MWVSDDEPEFTGFDDYEELDFVGGGEVQGGGRSELGRHYGSLCNTDITATPPANDVVETLLPALTSSSSLPSPMKILQLSIPPLQATAVLLLP